MAYSGMCEDNLIHELFGKQPKRFLDIGAGGAEVLSNTRFLLEQGWSGVWVDASYRSVPDLLARQKLFKSGQVEVIHAAISAKNELRRIYNPSDYLITTMSQPLQDRGHERTNAESFWMGTSTINDILAVLPGPYHFITIDIEGLSLEVMRTIDYRALECTAVCVEYLKAEHLGVDEAPIIVEYMKQHDFRHYVTTQENVICIR